VSSFLLGTDQVPKTSSLMSIELGVLIQVHEHVLTDENFCLVNILMAIHNLKIIVLKVTTAESLSPRGFSKSTPTIQQLEVICHSSTGAHKNRDRLTSYTHLVGTAIKICRTQEFAGFVVKSSYAMYK
jgi:hypothetical protein